MIVPVSKENEQEWAALCVALWPEVDTEERIRDRMDIPLEYEFLYYVNDEAIAFLSLSLRHDYVEGMTSSPIGYVEGIYVKPNSRGKGIAKELIEFAKKWTLEKGCKQLASDVELDNEGSRMFHNQVGFKELGRMICFMMDLD